MSKKLRVGFVGCGNHATWNLYPCLQYAPVELVSVCDLNDERRERVKRLFGAEAGFASYREMFKGPAIDAVLVCGPPELHQEAAIAALDAGFPVFTEKPPADDLKGALEVQEAAKSNQRHCMTGFMKRFGLRYSEAKAIASSKDFGQVAQVNVKYSHWNCRDLHWMLNYMSVHLFDLFRFYMGDLERITFERNDCGGQFSFSTAARSKSGVVGTIITSSQEPRVKEHAEIVGEGQLVVVRNIVELEYHHRVKGSPALGDLEVVRPDFAIPNADHKALFLQGYAGEVIEFANAVLEQRAPSVTIDDGVMAMRMVDLLENNLSGTYEIGDWAS